MKNWPGQLWIHIIGCCIFLALPFLFSPDGPGSIKDFTSRPPQIQEIIHYLLLLIFFYLNFYWFVPKFYFEKKYLAFAFITLLCFFAIAFLPHILIDDSHFGQGPKGNEPGPDFGMKRPPKSMGGTWFRLSHNLFLFFALLFFSLLLRIATKWRQTERERMTSELSYLRSQVNPHFLFNTLNSIYSLAIQKSDQTATAIVKLSALMRYVTTEADKDLVSLDKEVSYINDYIDLQRLRFGEEARINFTSTIQNGSMKIAPLILIAFIENTFKYGINAEKESVIDIAIEQKDSKLDFSVHNKKVVNKNLEEEGTGIGIQNTRNRLQLLYPGKHELKVSDDKSDYIVSLSLNLA